MSEQTPFLHRASVLLGLGALVVTTAVGVLAYLATRPSDEDRYRRDVAAFCAEATAGAPRWAAAITADGAWDRRGLRGLVQEGVLHNRRLMEAWRRIEPPDGAAGDHARLEEEVRRYTAALRAYARTLPTLPGSEFDRADLARPPGDTARLDDASLAVSAELARIGGASCAPSTP